jgi:hypothetical protein
LLPKRRKSLEEKNVAIWNEGLASAGGERNGLRQRDGAFLSACFNF